MSKTFIPPQAYTRDMLAEAFEWLRHQAPEVREQASNADSLVSIYLRAKRSQPNTVATQPPHAGPTTQEARPKEAPVSVENFKSDLKNLAQSQDFPQIRPGQYDFMETPPESKLQPFEPPSSQAPPKRTSEPAGHYNPYHKMGEPPHSSFHQKRPFQARVTERERVVELQEDNNDGTSHLDEKSLNLAKKVQEGLNLSSTQEAVRVLIAVGYEQIQKILPNTK